MSFYVKIVRKVFQIPYTFNQITFFFHCRNMNTTIQTKVATPDSTILDSETIISEIVITFVKIFLICLGSVIQLKIVLTCVKAKNTFTWQIDITSGPIIDFCLLLKHIWNNYWSSSSFAWQNWRLDMLCSSIYIPIYSIRMHVPFLCRCLYEIHLCCASSEK